MVCSLEKDRNDLVGFLDSIPTMKHDALSKSVVLPAVSKHLKVCTVSFQQERRVCKLLQSAEKVCMKGDGLISSLQNMYVWIYDHISNG